jgi:hypothetical protein
VCHRQETRCSAAPFLPLASPVATAFTTKRPFRPSPPSAIRVSAGDPGRRSSAFQENTGTAPPPDLVRLAGRAEVHEKVLDRCPVNSRHPHRRGKAVSLNQAGNHSSLLRHADLVHVITIYLLHISVNKNRLDKIF